MVTTIPAIALAPRLGMPKMTGRVTTTGLSRGWYRITNVGSSSANEAKIASAVFEIADGADLPAPLHAGDQPMIAVEPAFVPPAGAQLQLSTRVRSASTTVDLERAAAGLADVANIERWIDGEWVLFGEVPIRPEAGTQNAWTADVPALREGGIAWSVTDRTATTPATSGSTI